MDKEGFNTQKELWHNSGIANYSYTYSWDSYPPHDMILDVTVEGENISYELIEYRGKKKSEITDEDKISLEKIFAKEKLLIENIYKYIETSIEDAYKSYKKYPNYYYNNVIFEFTNQAPFMTYYKMEAEFMEKNALGNWGYDEIKIENFKVLP